MPIYGFTVDHEEYAEERFKRYQILLEHDDVISKETFLKHQKSAKSALIEHHPERLLYETGVKDIFIPYKNIAEKMCELFSYRPLVVELMEYVKEEENWRHQWESKRYTTWEKVAQYSEWRKQKNER
jgi:hypothetical protein